MTHFLHWLLGRHDCEVDDPLPPLRPLPHLPDAPAMQSREAYEEQMLDEIETLLNETRAMLAQAAQRKDTSL